MTGRNGRTFKLLAVPLVVLSAVLGLGFAKWCRTCCYEASASTAPTTSNLKMPDNLFRGWDQKPDLVLVLSGQEHGYLGPCGCSDPQYGGLVRRYNFMQLLRERGWDVVAVDVGDVPQMEAPAKLQNLQGRLKYVYSMKMLREMDYTAVGIGEYEAGPGLTWATVLGDYALNESKPRVVLANLTNADDYPDEFKTWQLAKTPASAPRVGVTSIVGPIVEKAIKNRDKTPQFGDPVAGLNGVLKEMSAKNVELRVLLYQGFAATPNLKGGNLQPEAIECAKAFPQFQVILSLDEADEPPLKPLMVDQSAGKPKTLVARVGHKGKYVTVVGVYKTGKANDPFEFKYQTVLLTPDFNTPKGEEATHPIMKLREDYQKELKDRNYLAKYRQTNHPLQVAVKDVVPAYVGSEACKKCHDHAYTVWKHSDHSHAYQTLVEPKKPNPPSNRQYDAECIVCHTVGFGYQTGFKDLEKTPKLINVGCESCHGPASEHVKTPDDKKWRELINPWKAPPNEPPAAKAKRLLVIDQMCQRCHDAENDVTWIGNGFGRKWPLVEHDD
jgi:Cytochrome c554 and c-prime